MSIASTNPVTGQLIRSFQSLSDAELDAALDRAAAAYASYKSTALPYRVKILNRAAELLDAEKATLGRLMVAEMGKPLQAAVEEVAKCALGCRYYAEHGPTLLADEPVPTSAARSFLRYQPLGVILAVMPWNFPFWQVFRFAAPALMAGNVGLLKHASNVPQCALAIEDLLRRAGCPAGVFQTLLIESSRVEHLLSDRRVAAATLTGSTGAGAQVAGAAGRQIKPTVLELGGSDPFVVMPSADLEAAVSTAVKARIVNNGQSCIAAKRFVVHEAIAADFEEGFVRRMRSLVVGDPIERGTDVGPLATLDGVETVAAQVERSVAAGARLLTGGRRLDGPGYFYEPTVLADIPPTAPAYREEVFGPVALLFRARDLSDAIRLANDSSFGLGASVWTRDANECERLVNEIEAGMVFVNGMVVSDPRLPFGGIKASGYGRELGELGIRAFVNVKTVWIGDGAGGEPGTGTE